MPDGKPNLSAPAPRAQEGKPDLSGIWLSTRAMFNVAQSLKEGDTIPFQPWARQVFEERQANHSKDDPSARCLPTGPTQKPTLVTPFKIVQIPGLTLILNESRTTFRQIFTISDFPRVRLHWRLPPSRNFLSSSNNCCHYHD